jgi:hypothetical protein
VIDPDLAREATKEAAGNGVYLSHYLAPPTPFDAGYRDILMSWCAVNRLPTEELPGDRPIEVDMTARKILFHRMPNPDEPATADRIPAGDRYGIDLEPATLPLLYPPAGRLLVGVPHCGHYANLGDLGVLACTVEVDPVGGRHRGQHRSNPEMPGWANLYPGVFDFLDGRPDVAHRSPVEKYILTMTALERLALPRRGTRAALPAPGHRATDHVPGLPRGDLALPAVHRHRRRPGRRTQLARRDPEPCSTTTRQQSTRPASPPSRKSPRASRRPCRPRRGAGAGSSSSRKPTSSGWSASSPGSTSRASATTPCARPC